MVANEANTSEMKKLDEKPAAALGEEGPM